MLLTMTIQSPSMRGDLEVVGEDAGINKDPR